MNRRIRFAEHTGTNPRHYQLNVKLDTICKKLKSFKESERTPPTASDSAADLNQQSVLKEQFSMIKKDMAAAKNDLIEMMKTKDAGGTPKAELKRLGDRVASVKAQVKAARPRSKLRFVPFLRSY